jgi:hypothetical protein
MFYLKALWKTLRSQTWGRGEMPAISPHFNDVLINLCFLLFFISVNSFTNSQFPQIYNTYLIIYCSLPTYTKEGKNSLMLIILFPVNLSLSVVTCISISTEFKSFHHALNWLRDRSKIRFLWLGCYSSRTCIAKYKARLML